MGDHQDQGDARATHGENGMPGPPRGGGRPVIPNSQTGLCWATIGRADFSEFVEAAARHSYGAVSLTVGQYRQLRDGQAPSEGFRRQLKDAGLRVTLLEILARGLPGVPAPDQAPPRAQDILVHDADFCFEAAAKLEAEAISLAHFLGRATPIAELIDAIGGLSRRAERQGVDLAIEFLPTTGIPDLATAMEIVTAVNSPNLGLLLDTWHLFRTGGSAADVRALPAEVIKAVQLNDGPADIASSPYVPGADRMLPGEGEFPLGDFLDAVLDKQPKLNLGIEAPNASLRALSADAAASRAAEATRRFLTLWNHRR